MAFRDLPDTNIQNSTPGNIGSEVENMLKMRNIGFEVLTRVVMESTIFWDTKLCSPLKVNLLFGGK
jgi:hypothetical protein